MQISIALSVYNGTNYIEEQLESFVAQTRLPDELVVVDDASTDDTIQFLNAFAPKAPFPVRIFPNAVNSGSTYSFDRAISNCTGDLIFLSDHDDVWFPAKLQIMSEKFERSTELGLLQANAEVVDENLAPLGWLIFEKSFPEEKRNRARREGLFRIQLDRNVVGGATCAFRSEFSKYFLPIPTELGILHDGWIGTVISAMAKTDFLTEPLMYYRQHGGQQVGTKPGAGVQSAADRRLVMQDGQNAYKKKVENIEFIIDTLETIARREPANEMLPRSIAIAKDELQRAIGGATHFGVRSNLSARLLWRIPTVLSESFSGRYHEFSRGFRSIARDLIDR